MNKRMTEKMIHKYQAYLQVEEKSRHTIEKYIRDIYKLYRYLDGKKYLRKEQILDFKGYLLNNYKPSSVNSILAAVNGFFDYHQLHHLRLKAVRTQRKVFAAADRVLTKKDYMRLLDAAKTKKDRRLYLVMLTLCSTGMRVGELCHVTVEAVSAGQVSVSSKNKIRTVLLPRGLQRLLIEYMKQTGINTGKIFVTRNGRAMDRSNIWRQMKKAGAAAGVEAGKVYPHNLRHLFARTYYDQQKDVVKLADILGHSSIDTTRIYTMTSGVEHTRQLGRLGLIV